MQHATTTTPYLKRCGTKVYKFGNRWHWNCGGNGRCLGGMKRTQPEAFTAAFDHVRDEHIGEIREHDSARCWCDDNGDED
jgi:hypothetical protein